MRNDAGVEGLVAWHKIQARRDAPVRLSYGHAMTVDTAQGSTTTEHIHALPSGSHAIHGFKAYTAASRHERTTWIVVHKASERRHLASRSMIGQKPEIGEQDVWRQIGENLSRQPQEGQCARHAAPDDRDAATGAATDRTAWRRTCIKPHYPNRVDRVGTRPATRRLYPDPFRPRRAGRRSHAFRLACRAADDHGAGLARPEHCQHRPATDRQRVRRAHPSAVGDHGFHAERDGDRAALRQAQRHARAAAALCRSDFGFHRQLGAVRARALDDRLDSSRRARR